MRKYITKHRDNITKKFFRIIVTLLAAFINSHARSQADRRALPRSYSSIYSMQMCKVYFDSVIVAHSWKVTYSLTRENLSLDAHFI